MSYAKTNMRCGINSKITKPADAPEEDIVVKIRLKPLYVNIYNDGTTKIFDRVDSSRTIENSKNKISCVETDEAPFNV